MSLPLSPAGRRYGFKKSEPDHRDFGISSFSRLIAAPAGNVDLEAFCGPKRDQGSEGSCTAHAGVGMREYLCHRYESQYPVLSPSFLYWKEREMDGTLDNGDCGSWGRTAVKVLNQFGVCRLAEEPYIVGDIARKPSAEQLQEALAWKSGAYHRLSTVADMRSCLASGYVFCIGFAVYLSFETPGLDASGTMRIPNFYNETLLGAHETLVIGYDDERAAFKVRNSWGENWGIEGNFWFPYSLMASPEMVHEAWICHLGKAWG